MASNVSAQAPAPDNDLSSLSFFLGRWAGVAEGQPGKGDATRRANMSRSCDRKSSTRSIAASTRLSLPIPRVKFRVRFRQFHVEGFVIHYQEPDSKPGTWGKTSRCIRGRNSSGSGRRDFRDGSPVDIRRPDSGLAVAHQHEAGVVDHTLHRRHGMHHRAKRVRAQLP